MVVLIITGRFNVTVRSPWQDDDVRIALQVATQLSERWGEDMAIMPDLSVKPMEEVDTPPLEIVRCPAALKKAANRR
jgi:hypothetical protein